MEVHQLKPLVSICIPCYNGIKFINETLSCLLNQSYYSLEIIVVDDHSTDGSIQFINTISDKRLNTLKAISKGAAAARNQAFKNCSGEYIIFFDADDLVPTNFIESQMSAIGDNQNNISVSKWGRFYDNDLSTYQVDQKIIKESMSFETWVEKYWYNIGHMTPPGRVLIPKKLLENETLWNENLSLNDDFEFYTKLFDRADTIIYNDHTDFYYRSGIGGLSSKIKGYIYQLSNYQSLIGGIDVAMKSYPNNCKVAQACANMLQNFIYDNYPNQTKLIQMATEKLKTFPPPTFRFPCGGLTAVFVKFLGWKIMKQIKKLIRYQ